MATQGTRRRRPPPCPRPSQGYPYASAGDPLPARASVGIPVHFCRHPHPDRALRRDTRTLLPAPPPRTRLRRSSSAPFRGAWAVPGRISGKQPYPGCSRWAAVPGSSPGSPHVLDRGDIATGGGADGEGELVPPPLSLTLQPPYFSSIPAPPAFLRGYPYIFPIPPPRDAGTTWR